VKPELKRPPILSGLRRAVAIALCAIGFSVPRAGAQGILLQGIADLEGWTTDTGSNLLTRNNGDPGALLRLQMWTAAEVAPGLVFYAQAETEGGSASKEEEKFKPELYQLAVRYSPSQLFVLDAGKSTHPMNTFAARRFSTRNPLIGSPDGYTQQYPLVVQLSGSSAVFDYRLAGSSLALSHENYIPEPGRAWRPVAGIGITPFVGLRAGLAATWGPYLSSHYTPLQLKNRGWKDYHQRIVSFDLQYSVGYLELRGEHARSSYDVPGYAAANRGTDTYFEVKYTFDPRFFAAVRAERNRYPFIASAGPSFWVSSRTDFDNAEFGVGYRLTASSLVKTSLRVDKWHQTDANRAFIGPGGHALAIQFSQAFDVMALLAHPE
jgi:hypothetical protein